jgi:hypothetical protein
MATPRQATKLCMMEDCYQGKWDFESNIPANPCYTAHIASHYSLCSTYHILEAKDKHRRLHSQP